MVISTSQFTSKHISLHLHPHFSIYRTKSKRLVQLEAWFCSVTTTKHVSTCNHEVHLLVTKQIDTCNTQSYIWLNIGTYLLVTKWKYACNRTEILSHPTLFYLEKYDSRAVTNTLPNLTSNSILATVTLNITSQIMSL